MLLTVQHVQVVIRQPISVEEDKKREEKKKEEKKSGNRIDVTCCSSEPGGLKTPYWPTSIHRLVHVVSLHA